MVHSILFFILGFLCAGFLALMVAPAIWRRAVILTRKRIEASVPLSVNEIQADKDRMRAEFAMSTRRLEMSIKGFKDKAAAQIIEINRNREELNRLAEERAQQHDALTGLEAHSGELRAELQRREEQFQTLSDRLADAQAALEERALEIDKLGRAYDEASFSSSSRQIELVARETEVEKLSGDVAELRQQRKDAARRAREAASETRAALDELDLERRKTTDLEERLARLMASLSDREEKLDRREKELERLRQQLKASTGTESEAAAALFLAEEQKVRLEAEVAELTLQMSTLLSGARGADIEKAMARLTAERERLSDRLVTMTRENKRLTEEMAALSRVGAESWGEERRESAILREQINDLAAEVVNLTAMLEGPDSPICRALAQPPQPGVPAPSRTIVSLADRVRALQEASATRAEAT